MKDQFISLNKSFEYYFNLLYSIYSFPNIFLPFFAGVLVTIFGNRIMYLFFGICIMFGHFITCLGCQYRSMTMMLIGRIVFGIGGESINVCQSAMIVKWFYQSSIALPLGLGITISRLGSVLNDCISPLIAKNANAAPSFWFGFVMCVISLIAIIAIFIIDYEKDIKINNNNNNNTEIQVNNSNNTHNNCNKFQHIFKQFNTLYWLLTFLCLTTYGCVMPFNYIATGFFTSTVFSSYSLNEGRHMAGVYMGIPFFIGAIMVPIFGWIIDKFGNRSVLTLISGCMCLFTFVLFYLIKPLLPLILLGVTYSIFASVIWPSISIAVDDKESVGMAYGLTTSIQSVGLAVNPLIVAGLIVKGKGYQWCLVFFAVLGFVSMILGIGLMYVNNYQKGGVLDKVKFKDEMKDEVKKMCENEDDERKQLLFNEK